MSSSDDASAPQSGVRGVPVSVVVATRDRRSTLLPTIGRLRSLPERPRVVVVDNASGDGSAEAVAERFPDVWVLRLPENLGAAARTVGVAATDTPYVAFADDDSWWAPGALTRAVSVFEEHPRLGLIAARVMVGEAERLDPTAEAMARSPLAARPGFPGTPVLGFVACGAVVRCAAYLAVGGFHPRFGIGGEEQMLAVDLASAGWELAYRDDVVAHHHPSPARDTSRRRRSLVRNNLWMAWLRRPLAGAAGTTRRVIADALRDADGRAGVLQALRGLPWVLRSRSIVAPEVEQGLRSIAA